MDSLRADKSTTPQEIEDLTQIIKSAETLEALVNDILFISKMQSTGLELNNDTFDVCELIEDITQLLALRWNGKPVEALTLIKVNEFSYEVLLIRFSLWYL